MAWSSVVVVGSSALTLAIAWYVLGRARLPRPPLGVMSLGDVAVMLLAIVLLPFLYLALPLPAVVGLFVLATGLAMDALARALLHPRWVALAAAPAALGADVGTALVLGPTHPVFVAINNGVLGLTVVAITSLWVQSGLRASDTAVLCAGVAVYDLVATSLLPLTDDLVRRLALLPLAPVVVWGADDLGTSVSIGLGDVLLATLSPLVQRKAFGSAAGLLAAGVSLTSLTLLVGLSAAGVLRGSFPVLVVLGPLVAVQYLVWRHRGAERTTWQYAEGAAGRC
jgi:hypothetical protein